MSAISSSLGSTFTGQTFGPTLLMIDTPAPIVVESMARIASTLSPIRKTVGVERLPARERQQLPRQRGAATGGELDCVGGARELRLFTEDFVFGQRLLDGVDVAADDHQQVIEIMRDAAGELAERIHLLGMGALRLRRLQRALGVPPFGDVARDLRKTDQGALLVADRIDDTFAQNMLPSLRTRRPSAFEASFRERGTERPRRQPGRPVGVGVEAGEMLADDFVRGIALDALARRHSSSKRCRWGRA